ARAEALADGRDYLVPDDVKQLAVPALAHRVIPRAVGADAIGGAGESAIRGILQDVPVPR
ncbi:MAG: AAA family ATPase, partial [Candidatus Rokuibacteriota bacterium]